MPPTPQDLEPADIGQPPNPAGSPLLQRLTTIVATCTTLCFVGLVIWALADRTLLANSDQIQKLFWAAIIIFGGAVPSFILSLFGQNANLRVTGKSLAFSVGGGYAVAIFAVYFINSNLFTPSESSIVRIIELEPSSPAFRSNPDPDINDPEVRMFTIESERLKYPTVVLHFPPNADRVTLTISGYIGSQQYSGIVEVTKTGRPIERKKYKIAESN